MLQRTKIEALFADRELWVGAAMLWIVISHTFIEGLGPLFTFGRTIGYGGVDMLLFASGLGCYCALDSNPDVPRFLLRRARRVVPAYWLFMLVWLPWRWATAGLSPQALLGNLLGLQYFADWRTAFNWYPALLWLLYLTTPCLKALVDRLRGPGQLVLLLAALLALSLPFWAAEGDYSPLLISLTRTPIYTLGLYFARRGREGGALLPWHGRLALAMAALGLGALAVFYKYLRPQCTVWGLYWYPFLLIAPGLCLLISGVFRRWKLTALRRFLRAVASASFELYLIHVWLLEAYQQRIYAGTAANSNLVWLLLLAAVVPLCLALKWAADRVRAALDRRAAARV